MAAEQARPSERGRPRHASAGGRATQIGQELPEVRRGVQLPTPIRIAQRVQRKARRPWASASMALRLARELGMRVSFVFAMSHCQTRRVCRATRDWPVANPAGLGALHSAHGAWSICRLRN